MRRYGVIIVPTIASTIAAVDIINNAKHRNLLEKCCPLFGRSMNAFFLSISICSPQLLCMCIQWTWFGDTMASRMRTAMKSDALGV
jgi:hypothetical protein